MEAFNNIRDNKEAERKDSFKGKKRPHTDSQPVVVSCV